VCVCVCVCERERKRERNLCKKLKSHYGEGGGEDEFKFELEDNNSRYHIGSNICSASTTCLRSNPGATTINNFTDLGPYSQHFIFFVTYK
jgi:hypothetical protein